MAKVSYHRMLNFKFKSEVQTALYIIMAKHIVHSNEINDIKNLFSEMDYDNKGQLSFAELKRFSIEMGIERPDEDIE